MSSITYSLGISREMPAVYLLRNVARFSMPVPQDIEFEASGVFYNVRCRSGRLDVVSSKGYRWDGPSGPAFDSPTGMRASLFHDVLYQAIIEGKVSKEHRKLADQALLRITEQDGMAWARRWLWYLAVRAMGWRAL